MCFVRIPKDVFFDALEFAPRLARLSFEANGQRTKTSGGVVSLKGFL